MELKLKKKKKHTRSSGNSCQVSRIHFVQDGDYGDDQVWPPNDIFKSKYDSG